MIGRGKSLTLALAALAAVMLAGRPASAQSLVGRDFSIDFARVTVEDSPSAWQFGQPASLFAAPRALRQASPAAQATPAAPPFEYSDGYKTRAKIHKIASFATLPLLATQLFLGQSLYDNATSGKKTAHVAVGSSIGVLFGVNSVTGAWNLIEARKDPHGRGLRLTHGILMLAADAGFFATSMLAPDDDEGGDRGAHRAMAITSIAVATTGYLIMLFGNR